MLIIPEKKRIWQIRSYENKRTFKKSGSLAQNMIHFKSQARLIVIKLFKSHCKILQQHLKIMNPIFKLSINI